VTTSKSQIDIVTIGAAGALGLDDRIVLQGTHGDDIVRSLLVSDKVRSSMSYGKYTTELLG
jgi:hypothetical protein